MFRRSPILAVLAAVVILGATSCGGSSSGAPAQPAAPAVSSAQGLQTEFVDIVRSVLPSVVEIRTPAGLGSGIVFDRSGNVVTNLHVVSTFKRFEVIDSSGKTHTGTLVGSFAPDDLAVVHVGGANLPAATFGDSSALQIGDIVLAIGNPLGFQGTVTEGIVSSLGRTVSEQNGTALPDVIQTSAAINPGNSGGALVNLEGRVVGIPTLDAIDPENNQLANSIGFAIPSNTVKAIAGQIVQNGHVVNSGRAYLGALLATSSAGRTVAVVSVTSGGPAASAGIVAGDRIVELDGSNVGTVDDVAVVLADLKPGARIPIVVRTPAGRSSTVTVTLGQFPGS